MKQFVNGFLAHKNNNNTYFNYANMDLADHKDLIKHPQDLSNTNEATQEPSFVNYQARNVLAERHANSHREYETLVKESEARLALARRIAGSKAKFNVNALNAEQATRKIAKAYAKTKFSHEELKLRGIATLQDRHDFAQHLVEMPSNKVTTEQNVKSAKTSVSNAAQIKAQAFIKNLVKPHSLTNAIAAQIQAKGFIAGFSTN